ncbi:MAG TPA: YiiX/YebB-like N1pC/P60 family cysteine hydrolase [Pirellulaceae bacterium]|nr:YiiX/YebB-like N1pC/P60 family cysteine hydrolase [Pirellulaceae bacterium]
MITGVLLVGIAFGPRYWKYWNYQPQEGDIIMQSLTRGPMINMIEGATKSPWSHCGIVMREQGRWVVYEASSYVEGTPLADVILRSRDEQYAIYRLKPEHRQHIPRVLEEVRKLDGLPYDTRYEMDDEKIYCSELIYKAYRNATGRPLGKLVRLDELAWQPYEQFIEKLEGGPVPLDRVMITPRDLAQAEQLELVYSGIAKP